MQKQLKLSVCGHTTNSWAEPRRSLRLALLVADAGRLTECNINMEATLCNQHLLRGSSFWLNRLNRSTSGLTVQNALNEAMMNYCQRYFQF
jgi:hypothetical protein